MGIKNVFGALLGKFAFSATTLLLVASLLGAVNYCLASSVDSDVVLARTVKGKLGGGQKPLIVFGWYAEESKSDRPTPYTAIRYSRVKDEIEALDKEDVEIRFFIIGSPNKLVEKINHLLLIASMNGHLVSCLQVLDGALVNEELLTSLEAHLLEKGLSREFIDEMYKSFIVNSTAKRLDKFFWSARVGAIPAVVVCPSKKKLCYLEDVSRKVGVTYPVSKYLSIIEILSKENDAL